MDEQTAAETAAGASKTAGIRYVVYVPDQGRAVFNAAQMKTWGPFVHVEAVFVAGVRVDMARATA